MSNEIEELYSNLNDLLRDICQFLSDEKLGLLSPTDRKKAKALIARSKQQLVEISKVAPPVDNQEYVDMDNKDEPKADTDSVILETEIPICPYTDLQAKQASLEVKYGYISMRRKFLLGFEKMRRVYGSIHNNWLLIYWTDKDLKPFATFDLQLYTAKKVHMEKNAKWLSFELISTRTIDRKNYFFTALTHKDMKQWVEKINQCHEESISMTENLIFEEDIELDDDQESLYATVVMADVRPKSLNITAPKTFGEGPPLPTRGPMPKLSNSRSSDSDGSIVSYTFVCNENNDKHHDDVSSHSLISVERDSFEESTDDDEDGIYESYISKKVDLPVKGDEKDIQGETGTAYQQELYENNKNIRPTASVLAKYFSKENENNAQKNEQDNILTTPLKLNVSANEMIDNNTDTTEQDRNENSRNVSSTMPLKSKWLTKETIEDVGTTDEQDLTKNNKVILPNFQLKPKVSVAERRVNTDNNEQDTNKNNRKLSTPLKPKCWARDKNERSETTDEQDLFRNNKNIPSSLQLKPKALGKERKVNVAATRNIFSTTPRQPTFFAKEGKYCADTDDQDLYENNKNTVPNTPVLAKEMKSNAEKNEQDINENNRKIPPVAPVKKISLNENIIKSISNTLANKRKDMGKEISEDTKQDIYENNISAPTTSAKARFLGNVSQNTNRGKLPTPPVKPTVSSKSNNIRSPTKDH